jgi:hypothetical protein
VYCPRGTTFDEQGRLGEPVFGPTDRSGQAQPTEHIRKLLALLVCRADSDDFVQGNTAGLSLACYVGGSLALLLKALWAVHSFHAAAVPATADLAVAGEHPVGDADDLRGAAVVVIKVYGG